MSIVGPRPALPAEVATYDDYQRQRLLVKPGITCYWQTRRNRDSITFDEWVDLDLWHGVEEGLDVKAIAERLVAEYDVETGRALADVEALLARMRERGFVED